MVVIGAGISVEIGDGREGWPDIFVFLGRGGKGAGGLGGGGVGSRCSLPTYSDKSCSSLV